MPGGLLQFKSDGDDTGMENLESITNYETIVEQQHDQISHTVPSTDNLANLASDILPDMELDDLSNILADNSCNMISDSLSNRVLDNIANMVSENLPDVTNEPRDINTYKQLKEYIMSDNSSFNNAIVDGKPILSPLTPLANAGTREKMVSGPQADDYHQLNIPPVKNYVSDVYSPLTPPPSNLPHPSTPNKNFLSPPTIPLQTQLYPNTPPSLQIQTSYPPPEFMVHSASNIVSFQNESKKDINSANMSSINTSIPSYNVNIPVNISTNSVYTSNDINVHYIMNNNNSQSTVGTFETSNVAPQFAKPIRSSSDHPDRAMTASMRSQFLNRQQLQQHILSGHRVLLPRMNSPDHHNSNKLLAIRPYDVERPQSPHIAANFSKNVSNGVGPPNTPARPGILNRPQTSPALTALSESRHQPVALKSALPSKQASPKSKKSKTTAKPKKGVKQKLNNKIRNKAGNNKKVAKLFDGDSLLAQLENPNATKQAETYTAPIPTSNAVPQPPSLVRPHMLHASQPRPIPGPRSLPTTQPPLFRAHSLPQHPPRTLTPPQSVVPPHVPNMTPHQIMQTRFIRDPNTTNTIAPSHPHQQHHSLMSISTRGIQHFNHPHQNQLLHNNHLLQQQQLFRHHPPPRLIAAPYINSLPGVTNTYQRLPHSGNMLALTQRQGSIQTAPDHVQLAQQNQ